MNTPSSHRGKISYQMPALDTKIADCQTRITFSTNLKEIVIILSLHTFIYSPIPLRRIQDIPHPRPQIPCASNSFKYAQNNLSVFDPTWYHIWRIHISRTDGISRGFSCSRRPSMEWGEKHTHLFFAGSTVINNNRRKNVKIENILSFFDFSMCTCVCSIRQRGFGGTSSAQSVQMGVVSMEVAVVSFLNIHTLIIFMWNELFSQLFCHLSGIPSCPSPSHGSGTPFNCSKGLPNCWQSMSLHYKLLISSFGIWMFYL